MRMKREPKSRWQAEAEREKFNADRLGAEVERQRKILDANGRDFQHERGKRRAVEAEVERLRAIIDAGPDHAACKAEEKRLRADRDDWQRTYRRAEEEREEMIALIRQNDMTLADLDDEVRRLKDKLKFAELYRKNAVALYRSANIRAWLHGDKSTNPRDLEDM